MFYEQNFDHKIMLVQCASYLNIGKYRYVHFPSIGWNRPTSATSLPHICWNLCQWQHKAAGITQHTSWDPVTNIHGWSSLLSCLCHPSFSEVLIPQLLHRRFGAFVLTTFSCEPLLYASYHFKPVCHYANQYPACNYWKSSSCQVHLLKTITPKEDS